jgi:hypothetical protein
MRNWGVLVVGACLGAAIHGCVKSDAPLAGGAADDGAPTVQSLAAEIETLKGKLPDQAHAMQDVGYHFSNLWFAADAGNWPLADFYWNETRSHMRWAVRIIPVRKDAAGREIDLGKILEAMETSPLAQLRTAIDEKNQEKFVAAYRFTLEGCYACHKASEKPYLRPQVPDRPETPIVNFDPTADWPK